MLAFGRDAGRDPSHLLIHCHAGISRSTAAMLMILAQAFPDEPEDAIVDRLTRDPAAGVAKLAHGRVRRRDPRSRRTAQRRSAASTYGTWRPGPSSPRRCAGEPGERGRTRPDRKDMTLQAAAARQIPTLELLTEIARLSKVLHEIGRPGNPNSRVVGFADDPRPRRTAQPGDPPSDAARPRRRDASGEPGHRSRVRPGRKT